jgi:hypothetical protein
VKPGVIHNFPSMQIILPHLIRGVHSVRSDGPTAGAGRLSTVADRLVRDSTPRSGPRSGSCLPGGEHRAAEPLLNLPGIYFNAQRGAAFPAGPEKGPPPLGRSDGRSNSAVSGRTVHLQGKAPMGGSDL